MVIVQQNQKKTIEKNKVLKSAKKLSDAGDKLINFYEEGFFPYNEKTFKRKEKRTIRTKRRIRQKLTF